MNRREWLQKSGAVIALAAGSFVLPEAAGGSLAFLAEQREAEVQHWLLQTGRTTLGTDLYRYASTAIDLTGATG